MAGKGKESVEQFLQRRIDVAVRPTLKILYGEAGIGDVPGYGGKEGEYVAPEPEAIGEPTEAQDEGQVLREKFADMALDAAHRFAAGDGNVETFIDELKDMYGEPDPPNSNVSCAMPCDTTWWEPCIAPIDRLYTIEIASVKVL